MIQPVKEKIILGIDPGTTIMGYGVLRVKGTKPEMIAMGIIDLRKFANHYLKLRHIHERVLSIIESYLPDELAIEAPFFGKNVQSMLKLGRAQGVPAASEPLLSFCGFPSLPILYIIATRFYSSCCNTGRQTPIRIASVPRIDPYESL